MLHVKGNRLVKGVHCEGLRVLGDPEPFARTYYQDGADELVFLDIVASLYGRSSLLPVIERVSAETFIPLTVGGGIRSTQAGRSLLRSGADKLAVNTGAVRRPELLRDLADAFGSQSVVLQVDARRWSGGWEVLTDNARETSGREVVDWVEEAVGLGAGEILLQSVDRDGTGMGYDLALVKAVTSKVAVPVIATGGAGTFKHLLQAQAAGADALGAASLFHYAALTGAGDSHEGNVAWLTGLRGSWGKLTPMSVRSLKKRLSMSLMIRGEGPGVKGDG